MTTNYQGDSSKYPANVRLPSDGDKRNATIFAMAATDLADRTAYISKSLSDNASLLAGNGGQLIPMLGNENGVAGSFDYIKDNKRGYWAQTFGALDPQVRCDVSHLMHSGEKIVSIAVTLKGSSGHASLPAIMPKLRLESIDCRDAFGTSFTTHIESIDSSPNVTYYQQLHIFECRFSAPITVDGARLYQIVTTGENGDGAKGGLIISNLFLQKTL